MLSLVAAIAITAPADPPAPRTAAESVRLALADARRLNPVVAGRTRYLSAHNTPPTRLADLDTVLRGLIPSLSRGTGRTGLRAVATVRHAGKAAPWLWAFDAEDYGTDLTVWAALRFSDPYYHAPTFDRTKEVAIPDFLPQLELRELAAITQTQAVAPIFRADYLIYRTSQQADRTGDGYYDFLGLRKAEDAAKLAGLDEQRADRIDADRRDFVTRSGPGLQIRQVVRREALHGPAYSTYDAARSTGENNVVALLDKAKADGGMGVFPLPNRLVFSFLFKVEKGKELLIDTAPDNVAGNRESVSHDLRIHPGSCQQCHGAGMLRQFDGEARKFFRAGSPFVDQDETRARRVRAVFLAEDFAGLVERDQDRNDAYMVEACGVGYREWGRRHKAAVADYLADVDAAKLAAETGYAAADIRLAVKRFAAREGAGRINPVVGLFDGSNPAAAVRRELIEEAFPTLMAVLRQEIK